MTTVLLLAAMVLLGSVAVAFWRVARGPTDADRMLGAQLAGTGGIGSVLLLGAAAGDPAAIDVALVIALLGAFGAIAFVKAETRDGAGEPEEEDG